MKKLILISALLFSFNGWVQDLYTDRPAINLVCKQTKVKTCLSKFDCESFTTEELLRTGYSEMVSEDSGVTLRETNYDAWEMTVNSIKQFVPLQNNILEMRNEVPKGTDGAGVFDGTRVTHSLNIITSILVYEVYDIEESYATLKIEHQCSKQQSLLD